MAHRSTSNVDLEWKQSGSKLSRAAYRQSRNTSPSPHPEIPVYWDGFDSPDGRTYKYDRVHTKPDLERVLIVPDAHRPFHNEAAWQLMLRAGRSFQPHTIITLGDIADFYSVSAHSKSPERKLSLADEVASVNVGLDELDSLGAETKHFIEGNHCFRLQRHLNDNSAALSDLPSLSVPKLFRLQERGWSFTPYQQHLKIGNSALFVTHDCGNAGSQAHVKARATFESSVIIGHTHRASIDYRGNAAGETHCGAMLGWMGDYEKIDYLHRVTALQWQLGFGIAFIEPDGTFHINLCPIINGRVLVAGKVIV